MPSLTPTEQGTASYCSRRLMPNVAKFSQTIIFVNFATFANTFGQNILFSYVISYTCIE